MLVLHNLNFEADEVYQWLGAGTEQKLGGAPTVCMTSLRMFSLKSQEVCQCQRLLTKQLALAGAPTKVHPEPKQPWAYFS